MKWKRERESQDVFLVCFSVVDPTSFHNVKLKWIPELQHHAPVSPVCISEDSYVGGEERSFIGIGFPSSVIRVFWQFDSIVSDVGFQGGSRMG